MAYTHVASVIAASSDGTNVTTGAVDTTGADTIFVFVGGSDDWTETPTDSKGNTWTALTDETVGGGERGRWFYAKAATVGTGHTFSFASTSNLPSIAVHAFSGGHLTAPLDQENAGGQAFGSTVQPGSVTPAQDDCVVLQGVAFNVAGTLSINESYTGLQQVDKTANAMGCATAYKIQTAAGATNPTWTHAPGSSSLAAVGAAFKPAGASPPPPAAGNVATASRRRYVRV